VLTRLAVCGAMGVARLAELAYSRRNIAAAGEAAEGPLSRGTYPFIVAVHVLAIVGTLVRGRDRASAPWLALLFAAQPLRLWVLVTLGRRWNARAAVPAEMEVATNGPYAVVRHPNYAVVGIELFALPMAFGLWRLALVVAAVNCVLVALRLREEEAALDRLPGYRPHFAGKKRFVPGVI
jgi:methyltransferase